MENDSSKQAAEQQTENVTKELNGLHLGDDVAAATQQQPSDEGRPASRPTAPAEKEGILPTPGPAHDPSSYVVDPTNFEIKHPLQNRWSLWYDNPGKRTSADTWGNHLKHIVDFDTVEDFWRLYNNVVPASQLEHGSNYHVFKVGIEPKWEDPANGRGGQWVLTLSNKQRKEKLDKLWLYTLLACIGEAFEEEDEICGCVVSIRKGQDRIAIWTKTASKEAVVRSIGMQMKRTLELLPGEFLGYQVHSDAMKSRSTSGAKHRFEV